MKTMKKYKYFDGEIKKGFMPLFLSKSIIRISGALLGIFLPIFLYQFFHESIRWVAGWYVVGSFLYVISLPLGAMTIDKITFRGALRWGSFLGFISLVIFYFAEDISFEMFILSSLVVLTLYRIFYWIPYHVDFAKFTDKQNRSKEVGLVEISSNVSGIFAPIIAGIILVKFGYDSLFFITGFIYLISIIPLFFLPRTYEKFEWSYFTTWKKLFSKKRRSQSLAFMADGAEQSVGLVIWPIFIFVLLDGNYLQLGILTAGITTIVIILDFVVGKYADKMQLKGKILKFGSIFYAIGWIIKIFVVTAFQIFLADVYHKLMKIFMRIPFDALTYEVAADQGHFVDEFTVLKEMALHIGKAIMLLIVIIGSYYFDITLLFILAALASVMLNFLRVQNKAQIV
jgi:MFS family permease